MNEVISELKKRPVHKHKKANTVKGDKTAGTTPVVVNTPNGYSIETPKEKSIEADATFLTKEMLPENWEMSADSMVKLLDDIMYVEDKVVIKNTGLKAYDNAPIGESEIQKEIVKSTIRFGEIVQPGKSTTYKKGDIITFNGQAAKQIDFDKRFIIVPHFMIYGKIVREQQIVKPNGKNLLGRLLQGFAKRLGFGNVHKSK